MGTMHWRKPVETASIKGSQKDTGVFEHRELHQIECLQTGFVDCIERDCRTHGSYSGTGMYICIQFAL